MARQKNPPHIPTASEKLHPSVLRQTQLELMGKDLDLSDLYLALNHKDINIGEAVTDVTVERTIEGASTVTVEIFDRDRVLLRSGRLSSRNDIEIDGLYFRLSAVRKTGDILELTFEDREIALLRTYAKPIKQSTKTARGPITRAQFILRMIKEVKEEKIRWVIPELNKPQAIDGASTLPSAPAVVAQKGFGIPKINGLKVKSAAMTEEQRKNTNIILNTAESMIVPRPVMVMAIMCAIQESSITNLLEGHPGDYNYLSSDSSKNPIGVYQQIAFWGWPATRDVAKDAAAFIKKCDSDYHSHPQRGYGDIINDVQISGTPGAYQQWQTQAERIVDAYGITNGKSADQNSQWAALQTTGTTLNYEFYRGLPPTSKIRKQKYNGAWGPESSWDCIQRLAQEVQWRAFFVSGTFYYISEDLLFKSQPAAVLNEFSSGVISLDGDYDEGSKVATMNLVCEMNRWAAPPGSIIQLVDMGPWNGRWLINDVSKSIYNDQGTITLKKPMPRLPEPSGSNIVNTSKQNQSAWTLHPTTKTPQRSSGRVPIGDRVSLAQQLLTYHELGVWRDDNGLGLEQIRNTAAGMMVTSPDPAVGHCFLQADVLRSIVWLCGLGWKVGTFAWCSDHSSPDGAHGHQGGWAVDISSLNGVSINQNTDQCRKNVLAVMHLFNDAGAPLHPRQLISGGYGNHRDMTLSALSIPEADRYYGSTTMSEHCNHIHVGYGIRKADGQFAWA